MTDIISQAKERSDAMADKILPYIDDLSLVDLKMEQGNVAHISHEELLKIRQQSVNEIIKIISLKH